MSFKSEACYRFMREAYRGLCVRPVVEGGYCPRLKVGIAAGGGGDFKAFSEGRGDFKAFSEARGGFQGFQP